MVFNKPGQAQKKGATPKSEVAPKPIYKGIQLLGHLLKTLEDCKDKGCRNKANSDEHSPNNVERQ